MAEEMLSYAEGTCKCGFSRAEKHHPPFSVPEKPGFKEAENGRFLPLPPSGAPRPCEANSIAQTRKAGAWEEGSDFQCTREDNAFQEVEPSNLVTAQRILEGVSDYFYLF